VQIFIQVCELYQTKQIYMTESLKMDLNNIEAPPFEASFEGTCHKLEGMVGLCDEA